jgi:hypothetical protein
MTISLLSEAGSTALASVVSGRSPLDEKDNLTSDTEGDDLVMFDHALGLLHPEGHNSAQGLGSLCNRGATGIVEADFGLHGDIDVANDRHLSLHGKGAGRICPTSDDVVRQIARGRIGRIVAESAAIGKPPPY